MKIRFLFLAFLVLIDYSLSNCCIQTAARSSSSKTVAFHVGVILDIESHVGRMCSSCIFLVVEDFYAVHDHYETRLVLHNRDSNDLVSAAFTAVDLSKVANVIITPQKPSHVRVVAELGIRAEVPVLSFSAIINPFISIGQMFYPIQMAKNETYQFKAISSIVLAYGGKDVLLIYEESEHANRTIPYLIDELQKVNVLIPYKILISPLARDSEILEELQKLSSIKTRVFIVHMSVQLGSLSFLSAKEIGIMSEDTSWIIIEEMASYLGTMDDNLIDSMSGVIGIHPYNPKIEELQNFKARMNRKINDGSGAVYDIPISCLHADDSILGIAAAAERVGTYPSFQEPTQHYTCTETLELAKELGLELSDSKLKGLNGEIRLLDGQLRSVVYAKRDIGFWDPAIGIVEKLNGISQSHLSRMIWPAETVTVPKVWRIPPYGMKLSLGFLLKNVFHEMVNICSNRTSVTDYCIDVFKTVMEALPYNVPYEFVPFEYEYDDMVQQLYKTFLDAAVGDTEITVNRSSRVDFSSANTDVAASLNCTSHWALLIIISVVSLFSFVLHLLLCIFRNSINNFWKRLKGIFHIEHGERSEARELDGHNIMVSIDPSVFVKDSKQ